MCSQSRGKGDSSSSALSRFELLGNHILTHGEEQHVPEERSRRKHCSSTPTIGICLPSREGLCYALGTSPQNCVDLLLANGAIPGVSLQKTFLNSQVCLMLCIDDRGKEGAAEP